VTAVDPDHVVLGVEDPAAPDVAALIAAHRAFAGRVTPPDRVHAVAPDGLTAAEVVVLGMRSQGELLAVGALRPVDPTHVELKTMHVREDLRGRGLGRVLLDRLLAEAAGRGFRQASLETGDGPDFAPARALYEAVGFRRCPPFGPYRDVPHGVCLTRSLP
jgi:putative acetyltransferase